MAGGSLGSIFYDVVAKDKTAEGLDSASNRVKKVGTAVGAAMTAVGGGMTLLTDKARQMNAPLEATALQLGVTSAEMRNLALEISNVTFPLEEAISSMDLLTRAGMTNTEEIAATATAFDVLGDATGYTASQITNIMIPAFNAFGLELKDAGEYTDLFTHMQRNTTIEMSDFSSMLKYIAPDIDKLGISLEESVAVMEALADKGIQGSSATREFRTAITEADGNLETFYTALGLTSSEVATYTGKLAEADGMTQQYADAMNTQYGFMDTIKHSISELTLKYGAMLQPVEALGPSMAALGPIMIVLSNINFSKLIPSVLGHVKAMGLQIASLFASGGALTAHSIAAGFATAAQWLFNAALNACPLVWIFTAIGAVIGVVILLEKKFGILTTAVRLLSDAVNAVIGFFSGIVDKIRGVVVDTDKLAEANDRLRQSQEDVKQAEEDLEIAHQNSEIAAEELEDASARLAEAQLAVGEAAKEVEKLESAYEELLGAMKSVEDFIEKEDDLQRRREGNLIRIEEAEIRLSEAIQEHGIGSLEARKADLSLRDARDALEDTDRDIIEAQEQMTKADTEYSDLCVKNGVESAAELKGILDKKISDNEDGLAWLHQMELEHAEAKDVLAAAETNEKRREEVLDMYKRKSEETASEIERIQEGEVDSAESTTGKIKTAIENGMNDALDYLGGLWDSFVSAGANIINAIVEGIKSVPGRIAGALGIEFDKADKQIPHSDAEEGPFSRLTEGGKSVVETFAAGIESKSGSVSKSLGAGIAPSATGGTGGSISYGGNSISIGHVSLRRDYDFEALMKDIEKYQNSRRIQRGIRTI